MIDKEADLFYDIHIRPILKSHLDEILPITTAFSAASLIGDGQSPVAAGATIRADVESEMDEVQKKVKEKEDRVEREAKSREESAPKEVVAEP